MGKWERGRNTWCPSVDDGARGVLPATLRPSPSPAPAFSQQPVSGAKLLSRSPDGARSRGFSQPTRGQRPFWESPSQRNRGFSLRVEGRGRRRCQALPFLFILFSRFVQESDEHHRGADPCLSAMHPPRGLGHGEAAGGARPRPRPPAARPRRPGSARSAPPVPSPCAPAPGRPPLMGPAPPRCAPGVR